MTTLFLARKLVTIALDKNAFEKNIEQLKSNRRKRKRAAIKLRDIVSQQTLHRQCRLCLKGNGLDIAHAQDGGFNILRGIKFVFGFEVNNWDGKPQHICETCLESLKVAVEFKELVEMTQWRLDQELEMMTQPVNQEPTRHTSEQDALNGGRFRIEGGCMTRQWVCRTCQQAFTQQVDLDQHDDTLCSEHLPYMCDECGKKTKSLHSLQKHKFHHLQSHEQEKWCRFKCQSCPRRFRYNAELIQHRTSHSADRPMKCELCPATFKSKSNLHTHRRTHFPPKFQCQHCPKAFRIRACLTNHLKAVHEKIKSIACTICHLTFTIQRNARKHELRVHKLKKKTRN